VKNLETMVNIYYKPLKANAMSPNPFVTVQEVAAIFSNIELILNVNKELLANLEKKISAWSNEQCIGDVFRNLAPFV
jgi:hypothetical protein